ncbi:MAG: cholesterol oxidase substrate-binding domain-containing protein [Minicystis sp.]
MWTVAPTKPPESLDALTPYNYPFADRVPDVLQRLVDGILRGIPALTPEFGWTAADVTAKGLRGEDIFGTKVYRPSFDLWGPSKNTLLYIQDTTLRVTANGYAVQMRKADVQRAVHDFTTRFTDLLNAYAARSEYPINSALEIRVTELDDPARVAAPGRADSPVLSSLSKDEVAVANGWDVALWLDVLTLPGTPLSSAFYHELEQWIVERFSGAAGRPMPEWSKGWGYTAANGAWTDPTYLERIRAFYTRGRASDHTFAWAAATLDRHDRAHLFSNRFLDGLFR